MAYALDRYVDPDVLTSCLEINIAQTFTSCQIEEHLFYELMIIWSLTVIHVSYDDLLAGPGDEKVFTLPGGYQLLAKAKAQVNKALKARGISES
ncbi:unnamed protein product [Strongylus vulgaris]|uniref:Uncharacterized protein n=1 Tax=Strongylus vulgaris TaxID=40348 RepID=A0A3P7KIS1_STRVU|nr:unnamed protein product [Strongylus vulgaris]